MTFLFIPLSCVVSPLHTHFDALQGSWSDDPSDETKGRLAVGREAGDGADESGLMLRVMHVNVTGTGGAADLLLWDYLSQNICILPSQNA